MGVKIWLVDAEEVPLVNVLVGINSLKKSIKKNYKNTKKITKQNKYYSFISGSIKTTLTSIMKYVECRYFKTLVTL